MSRPAHAPFYLSCHAAKTASSLPPTHHTHPPRPPRPAHDKADRTSQLSPRRRQHLPHRRCHRQDSLSVCFRLPRRRARVLPAVLSVCADRAGLQHDCLRRHIWDNVSFAMRRGATATRRRRHGQRTGHSDRGDMHGRHADLERALPVSQGHCVAPLFALRAAPLTRFVAKFYSSDAMCPACNCQFNLPVGCSSVSPARYVFFLGASSSASNNGRTNKRLTLPFSMWLVLFSRGLPVFGPFDEAQPRMCVATRLCPFILYITLSTRCTPVTRHLALFLSTSHPIHFAVSSLPFPSALSSKDHCRCGLKLPTSRTYTSP